MGHRTGAVEDQSVCVAAGGRACSGVRSSSRRSRAFSARSAATSASDEDAGAPITARRAQAARRTSPCDRARAAARPPETRRRPGRTPPGDQPANPPQRRSPTASSPRSAPPPAPTPRRPRPRAPPAAAAARPRQGVHSRPPEPPADPVPPAPAVPAALPPGRPTRPQSEHPPGTLSRSRPTQRRRSQQRVIALQQPDQQRIALRPGQARHPPRHIDPRFVHRRRPGRSYINEVPVDPQELDHRGLRTGQRVQRRRHWRLHRVIRDLTDLHAQQPQQIQRAQVSGEELGPHGQDRRQHPLPAPLELTLLVLGHRRDDHVFARGHADTASPAQYRCAVSGSRSRAAAARSARGFPSSPDTGTHRSTAPPDVGDHP